jgi:hypothetical protein
MFLINTLTRTRGVYITFGRELNGLENSSRAHIHIRDYLPNRELLVFPPSSKLFFN